MPYWRLFYHIVWVTAGRQPLIAPDWQEVLHNVIAAKAAALGAMVHAVGGIEDHVHLAVSAPPTVMLATFIGQIKGASSHFANRELGLAARVRHREPGQQATGNHRRVPEKAARTSPAGHGHRPLGMRDGRGAGTGALSAARPRSVVRAQHAPLCCAATVHRAAPFTGLGPFSATLERRGTGKRPTLSSQARRPHRCRTATVNRRSERAKPGEPGSPAPFTGLGPFRATLQRRGAGKRPTVRARWRRARFIANSSCRTLP